MLSTQKTGLALGLFFAIMHAAWQALVWVGSAQTYLNWILQQHSLKMGVTVAAFNATAAITLVIVSFATGYVFGWVFALVWNRVRK